MSRSQTKFCSLSQFDSHQFVDTNVIKCMIVDCRGDAFDETVLYLAVGRAIEKLKILSGRLQEKKNGLYQIKVILEPSNDYESFTSAFQNLLSTNVSYPHPGPNDAGIVNELPNSYFKNSTRRPQSAREYIEQDAPLISLYVTKLANIVCIGVEYPHFIMDGSGFNLFWEIVTDEFHMRESQIYLPLLEEVNCLESKLKSSEFNGPIGTSSFEPNRDTSDLSLWTVVLFFLNSLWEKIWHRTRPKMIYIGREVLESIVSEAKQEIKPPDFISTNDFVMAWILKTIYKDEKEKNQIISTLCVSSNRAIFDLKCYIHNALSLINLPTISASQIQESKVSEIALLFREGLEQARCLDYIRDEVSSSKLYPSYTCPKTRSGVDFFIFTNQSANAILDMDYSPCMINNTELDEKRELLAPLIGWFVLSPRPGINNLIRITEVIDSAGGRGNFYIRAELREKSWFAICKEIEVLRSKHSHRIFGQSLYNY